DPDLRAEAEELKAGVSLEDFYAYMPEHKYIYTPTRQLWPASSVNARVPSIPLSDEKTMKPSTWLDQNRPVEQMTWAPGLPEIIEDQVLYEGGWRKMRGVHCFNLYLPPAITPGDPAQADLWLNHVRLVYPEEAEHILDWLAHRVQRPEE